MSNSDDHRYVQIKDLKPGMKSINAKFIVLEVGPPTLTKEAREVRTLRVADASACVNLSVWDEPGALLQPGDIVRLTRGYAALWRSCLTLYSGKSGDIQKVGEFTMQFNEQVNMSEPQSTPIVPSGDRNNGAHAHGPMGVLSPHAQTGSSPSTQRVQGLPKPERYTSTPCTSTPSDDHHQAKLPPQHKTYVRGGRGPQRGVARR